MRIRAALAVAVVVLAALRLGFACSDDGGERVCRQHYVTAAGIEDAARRTGACTVDEECTFVRTGDFCGCPEFAEAIPQALAFSFEQASSAASKNCTCLPFPGCDAGPLFAAKAGCVGGQCVLVDAGCLLFPCASEDAGDAGDEPDATDTDAGDAD